MRTKILPSPIDATPKLISKKTDRKCDISQQMVREGVIYPAEAKSGLGLGLGSLLCHYGSFQWKMPKDSHTVYPTLSSIIPVCGNNWQNDRAIEAVFELSKVNHS